MIWLLLGIFVILIIISAIGAELTDKCDGVFVTLCAVGMVGAIVTLCIALFFITPSYQKLNYIDTKIEYLTEENAKIDEDVKAIVASYQDHEKEFYKEFENVSASTLITLYPEIKSDTLVNSQIEIYLENQKEIKNLNLQKIDGGIVRWWMCFGD